MVTSIGQTKKLVDEDDHTLYKLTTKYGSVKFIFASFLTQKNKNFFIQYIVLLVMIEATHNFFKVVEPFKLPSQRKINLFQHTQRWQYQSLRF